MENKYRNDLEEGMSDMTNAEFTDALSKQADYYKKQREAEDLSMRARMFRQIDSQSGGRFGR